LPATALETESAKALKSLGIIPTTQAYHDYQVAVRAVNAELAGANRLQDIVANLGKSLSLSNAGTQLQSGLQQLAGAYEDTFAKVDCGS